MKEILYIQAGSLANYTGTHYWNTQESYFNYNESDEAVSSQDISFREGVSYKVCLLLFLMLYNQIIKATKGEPTLCPRLLVFDLKCKSILDLHENPH